MTYPEFREAVEVFSLGERATLEHIKVRHRQLVKEHHPDRGNSTDLEAIRRINRAHELLTQYCRGYHYCFSEEEFLEQTPTERIRRQFGWDPVWGGSSEAQAE
jgi:DnaJ-class molecular chaperone